jgi:hypothetical protein
MTGLRRGHVAALSSGVAGPTLDRVLRKYLRPARGGLALTSLGTLGVYFVTVITGDHPQPWWPYLLLFGVMVFGGLLYHVGQRDARASAPAPVEAEARTGETSTQSGPAGAGTGAQLSAPPARIRLMPELDTATNHLGALNRGESGRFRAEVIDAHNQDGEFVGPRSWPVPWLADGAVASTDIPTAGKPLLDFAHFDYLRLKDDLEGTQWLKGDHWVFPSLPEPIKLRYSAVRMWPELVDQYFRMTVRVIRDNPPGHVDAQFQVGVVDAEPYCREIEEQSGAAGSAQENLRQLRELAQEGKAMRARLPAPGRRGLVFLANDLTSRFEAWKTEVAGLLELWPKCLDQFTGNPNYGLTIFEVQRQCAEIEHRTRVLDQILQSLSDGSSP